MKTANINKVKKSIKQRVKLLVEQKDGDIRVVIPYVMYVVIDKDTNRSKILLNCYQEVGDSSSGKNVGWKNIVIDDEIKVSLLDVEFQVSPEGKLSDRFKNVIASVY